MNSLIFIILLIVSLGEFFLANFVYYKGQASTYQRLAVGRCLCAGLFILASAFFYSSNSLNDATVWNQVRFIPLLILPGLTFLFCWHWTRQKKNLLAQILTGFVASSTLVFLTAIFFTDIAGFPVRQTGEAWVTIFSSAPFWQIIVSAWTMSLFVFTTLLAIFYFFNIHQIVERKVQLPIFLALAGNVFPAVLVGLFSGPGLPDLMIYLPSWVLLSDVLIGLGVTSQQFFNLNFTSAFQPILQAMQEAVALVSPEFKIQAANTAFCRLVERTESELLGQPLDEIFFCEQIAQNGLARKFDQEASNQFTLECCLKSGKTLNALVITTPIFDKLSRLGGFALIIPDNSFLKEADLKSVTTTLETGQFSLQIEDLNSANKLLEEDLQLYKLEEMQWRRRVFELESLTNLSLKLRTARSVQEMLAILLRETAHILEADFGMILLRKANELVVKSLYGLAEDLKGHKHVFGPDVVWQVYDSGGAAFLEMAQVEMPSFFPEATSVAMFPLRTSEKQLGLFVLGFKNVKVFSEANQRLIQAIGDIASNALYRSNTMDTLEQRVISRNRELETLYQVASLANEAREPSAILGQTLRILMETLNAKASVIYLNEKLNQVQIAARPAEYLQEIEDDLKGIAIENSIWRYIYQMNQSLLVQSLDDDNRIDVRIVTELLIIGNCSCIGAPVRGSNESIGAICLFKDAELPFGQEDLALLSTAAHQLGVAIEIIRLRKMEERNAIGAERQRLAGELHDSISQLLSSQYLYTEASEAVIQSGDRPKALEYMDQIRRASHQALKEMRLLIHELRPAPIASLGLYGALQHRLETVERRAHIEATLSGDYGFRLPGNMEESLYMIAQDALNYSIKNSQATRVNVRLDSDYDSILLEVNDDGKGIDPAGNKEKNGISRLRERIENLGGNFKTESIPGKGTTLRITI